MPELPLDFFSGKHFIPHGHCYLWQPGLVWLHLLSDTLIALAYYSIPFMLVYFVRRRDDVPFSPIFWMFGAFIAACGTSHIMEVWTLWNPTYWVSGTIKALTAIISLYTASELYNLIPIALTVPSPQQLNAEIERRKETEKALRESERRFRAIFERTFQFMGLLQPDGTLIEANQTALDFVGVEAKEVIGKPFWEDPWWSGDKNKQREVRRNIEKAAAGEFIRYEVEITGENDRKMTIDFSMKPLFNEKGEVYLIIPEGRDITALKKIEAELEERVKRRTEELELSNLDKEKALERERQARSIAEITRLEAQTAATRLSLTLEACRLGLWDWDVKSDRVYWTPYHEIILGYTPGNPDRTYGEWAIRVHPDDLAGVERALQTALAEKSEYRCEYRVIHPDNTIHWVQGLGRGIIDENGEIGRMVGIIVDISARKATEKALRESEERFRISQELSLDAFTILRSVRDDSGEIVDFEWSYINPTAAKIFQKPSGEMIGRGLLELLPGHKNDSDLFDRYVRVATTGEPHDLEVYYNADNIIGWFRNMTVKIEDGIAIFFTDISERKYAELALQESEQRYATLARLSPVGIFRCDASGYCFYVNDRWSEMTGMGQELALGQGWVNTIHPDDRQRVLKAWTEAVNNNNPFRLEYRFQKGNSFMWVLGQALPEKTADDTVISYIGTVTDINERKLAEEALRQSEERYRVTYEQAPIGISNVALDGHWLSVNQKLLDIVGYSERELLNTTFQSITHPEDVDRDVLLTERLKSGEIDNYKLEKRYIRGDGSIVWANISVSLLLDGEGNPLYFIGMVEDISSRKRAELELMSRERELRELNTNLTRTGELLKKRNQELDRFAYIVSHDLKAPLRAIANLSEWISEDLEGEISEENQQQMTLLRERVYRMENLIKGLLEYCRIGRASVEIEMVDTGELLTEIIDSIDPPRSFTLNLPAFSPTFPVKKLLLSQVFANLINNAIKHHDRPDGNIDIIIHDRGDNYEFIVRDDGPGIEEKYHDKIFGIFQTLTNGDNPSSTGIGLTIVKKIVETEGGIISLESKIGQGTSFVFTWPKQPKIDLE